MSDSTIHLDEDVYIKLNNHERTAILVVGAWESFIQYDKAHEITKDSPDVAMLRGLSEI